MLGPIAPAQDSQRLDILATFQEAVVRMLWSTTAKAASQLKPRSLMLSGGVAANSRLKEYLAEKAAEAGLEFYFPKPILTSDNAAMIAARSGIKRERARRFCRYCLFRLRGALTSPSGLRESPLRL
jgi:tRNA A37 threonylcarbamoyltransferase TsaD